MQQIFICVCDAGNPAHSIILDVQSVLLRNICYFVCFIALGFVLIMIVWMPSEAELNVSFSSLLSQVWTHSKCSTDSLHSHISFSFPLFYFTFFFSSGWWFSISLLLSAFLLSICLQTSLLLLLRHLWDRYVCLSLLFLRCWIHSLAAFFSYSLTKVG